MHGWPTAYAERMAMSDSEARVEIRALWRRVAAERLRAVRAGSIASRYEARLALAPESLRPVWGRLKDLHRQIEDRHLTTARITELHALRTEKWLSHSNGLLRPAFISAVASSLGTPSATAALCGPRHACVVVTASDATARAAYELETTMVEGPAIHAAAQGASIAVAGTTLLDRWPRYGPAAAELGVRAVIAAPLGPAGARLGALCAYRAEPVIGGGLATATERMADVLTQMILGDASVAGSARGGAVPRVFDEGDYRDVVHQAAGMVSVQCDCAMDAAQDVLVARAFADGVPVEQIAAQVVRGEIDLG